jgi:isopenicillin-N epimerase
MSTLDSLPWPLDPSITFLNHGSFGSCPRPVQSVQRSLRDLMEARPIEFLARELDERLDVVRGELGDFLSSPAQDLVFLPNVTNAVNSVLRSFPFDPGDELLVTDHEYNACRNVLEFVAACAGCKVVVAEMPWPVTDPQEIVEAVLSRISARTRLLFIDHITSATALVMPLERIIPEVQSRGVRVLVDGAHAPGQIDLNLNQLGADYYTGNCHKWINAPKGAAFLAVPERWQAEVRPACISHGANSPREDRSRYLIEFDWTGTADPTAILSIPSALQFMEQQLKGGWPAVRAHNHALAVEARQSLLSELGLAPAAPESMLGAMATIELPPLDPRPFDNWDPLQTALREQYRIEVPIVTWGGRDGMPSYRGLRVSAQLYNDISQYQRLAVALHSLGASSAPV